MAILYDADGNQWLGSRDQIGGQTYTESRALSSVLAALNAEQLMDLHGQAIDQIDVRTAAASLTLVAEGTVDGTNYFSIPLWDFALETMVTAIVITTTHAKNYVIGVSGFKRVRVRVSAYTSGNVAIAQRGSQADYAIYNRPVPTTLAVTVTAAANAGATLTLPAPGVGLFIYLVSLFINRTATAALAGTATLVITTTNLPGALAFSVGNAMVAGGTQRDLEFLPCSPLKSSTANTAVTVVAPVPGAAVLWRLWATYYVGA